MKRNFFYAIVLIAGIVLLKKLPDDAGITKLNNTIKLKSFSKINENSIVFIGDSHITFFPLTEWFNDTNVLNNGINGDKTSDVLHRIGRIAAYRPKSVFLQIGINDILSTDEGISGDTSLLNNYRKIICLSQKISPETDIYINSIMPVSKNYAGERIDSITSRILSINEVLQRLAFEKGCTYIDVFHALASSHNRLPFYLTVDGLHLNRLGYNKWFHVIKSAAKR